MNTPRPTNSTAVRGAAIALIFVVLGVAILVKVFNDDDDGNSAAPSATDVTETVVTDPTGSTVPTTTAPPATIPKGNIKVVVANAARLNGAAGRATELLVGQGFTVTSATTATDALDTTVIYYREGYDAPAQEIATILGAKTQQVLLMIVPEPALEVPVTPADHVLVMLGKDLAK